MVNDQGKANVMKALRWLFEIHPKRTILPDYELTAAEFEKYKDEARQLLANRVRLLGLRCQSVVDSIELRDGWVRVADSPPGGTDGTDLFINSLRRTLDQDLNREHRERCPYCDCEFRGLFAHSRLLDHEWEQHHEDVVRRGELIMEWVWAPLRRAAKKRRAQQTGRES